MNHLNRMSASTHLESKGASTPNNYFAQALNAKPLSGKKHLKSPTLEELPHEDDYYLAKYGLDKKSYLAFIEADQFAYQVCYALEEAEYADPNYNPFFP